MTVFSNRRSLFYSVIALIICIIMLLGATYAWFTDSATSPDNNIQTGNLDVEMYWAKGTEDPASTTWTDASTGAIFDYDLWEPGYAEVRHIKIANEGTLSLKYKVNIIANGEVSDLSDVIDVYYVDPAVQVADSAALASAPKIGTLTDVLANLGETGSGELPAAAAGAESAHTITIALKMQENAGNQYMNKSIGTSFSIQLVATQLADEEGSFGKEYDKDATYPNVSAPVAIPTEDVTESVPLTAKGMKVSVPAEVINNLPAEVTSIAVAFSDPVVEGNTISFASVEFVDQKGQKIDLESNTEEIAVTLPAQTTFTPGTTVEIYHDGEKMATASVDDDGTISYSATHWCEVDITSPKNAYYVATSEEFYTEVYYGGMVIPTEDITLSNYLITFTKADIYLNGKNITAQNNFLFVAPDNGAELSVNGVGTINTGTGYAGYADKKGVLIINGGTFNLGNTNNKAHFYTQNSGKTVINGGTFISNDANTPIMYCINGFIEINGGFFQNTANSSQALLDMGNNINYANNQRITISGGTFVNWNPMDSAFAKAWTNPDVPALIVLAEGYQMISETQANGDVWYTVIPVEK